MNDISMPQDEQKTVLLLDIFKSLDIHPILGLKLFVKNAPIDETALDLHDIPFCGHKVKIYRMRNNANVNIWRVSEDMAVLIKQSFYNLSVSIRNIIKTKSLHFYELEKSTREDVDMQISRLLLGLYENQTVKIRASISDYCKIDSCRNPRLRVSLKDLRNPDTSAVYADHTHVLLKEQQIDIFSSLPIGTTLEFQATVHSYGHMTPDKKYGIHNLQDIRVLETALN